MQGMPANEHSEKKVPSHESYTCSSTRRTPCDGSCGTVPNIQRAHCLPHGTGRDLYPICYAGRHQTQTCHHCRKSTFTSIFRHRILSCLGNQTVENNITSNSGPNSQCKCGSNTDTQLLTLAVMVLLKTV